MTEPTQPKIISFDRYTLYAPAANANGRKARLVFSIRDGLPRITVFTNDAGDTDPKQMISVPVDPIAMISLLDQIVKAATAKEETRTAIECFVPVRAEDGKIMDRTIVGQIIVGRDGSGLTYLSVVAEGRPRIKFPFVSGTANVFKKADGSTFTESELSSMAAISTAKCLNHIYMIQFERSVVDWSNRPKEENKSGYSGSSSQKSKPAQKETASFDDIPY